MRTDMKVGILAGLVIALVIVIYVFNSNRGGEGSAADDVVAAPDVTADKLAPAGPEVTPVTPPYSDSTAVRIRVPDDTVIGLDDSSTDLTSGPLPPTLTLLPEESTAAPPQIPETAVVVSPPSLRVTPGLTDLEPSPGPAPAPVPPPPAAGAPSTYIVEKGDNFWTIAEKQYGDGSKYVLIAKANPKVDPNRLRIHQTLIIPPLPKPEPPVAVVGPAPAPAVAPTATTPGEYVVQAGDLGFWGIAKKVYGDGSKWYLLEKANPNVDPRRLRVNMRLKVPALSEAERAPKPATSTRPAPALGAPTPPSDGRPRFDLPE